VYQVDFREPNLQESLFKVYESGGSEYVSTEMTRAVDNKIYLGGRYVYSETEYAKSALFSIEYPNQPKNACIFRTNSLLTASVFSFPGLINDVVMQAPEAPAVNFNFPKEVSVCFGTYTLTAPAGYGEYRWSNGATTSSITVNEPGLYSVVAGAPGFTKPEAYGFTTVYSTGKNLNYGKDTTICPKTAFTLTIPYTYTNILWQDGDTSHIHRVPKTSTKERVTTIDPNGCQTWDSICVYMKTNPSAEFGKDTTLCDGQTLTLQLQPYSIFSYGAVYSWQDGSTKDAYKVTRPGQYWGKATYEGCTVSDTINVSYVNADGFSLGKDSSLCIGDSLLLSANILNAQYEWNTGATTQNILIKNPGSCWVKVNNGSCTVSDTISITFNQPPVLNLGNDMVLCERDSVVLQAGIANARFLWQDGSIKDAYTVRTAGSYSVQVQKDGCTVNDTIQIGYKPLPVIDLGKDTDICEGQKLTLQASHSSITDYLWQDGSRAPLFEASAKGTYWVKTKGTNGCLNTDTIIINTKPLPDFTLGIDQTLCEGESKRYNFNLSAATYLWSDQTTSGNYNIIQPGTYWLEVTQNGCSKRDSIFIQYKPSPVANLGADTTLCEGTIKELSAFNTAATYTWQDGSSNAFYEVNKAGKYSVSINLNGCIRKDTIEITYLNLPRFSLGNDTTLCNGYTMTLQTNVNDASYHWQDGTTTPDYIVTDPGIYSVTVTNTCGSQTDKISINRGICQIKMPNVFTPNKDGKNDVFRVKYPQFIKKFKMTIYNRWGAIIYESTDAYKGWNGMHKGLPQPEGNYIWMISIVDNDGISGSYQGNVYLLR
jgi:gliding motility-associated-like protein